MTVQALQRLTEAAEKAKMELSSLSNTSISLPFITATADGPKHIETSISRAKFEDMCSDLLDRCRVPVEAALRDAKLKLTDINEVILVGGSTRIPAVQVWPPCLLPWPLFGSSVCIIVLMQLLLASKLLMWHLYQAHGELMIQVCCES